LDLLEAILLGIVQGIFALLPISSIGYRVLTACGLGSLSLPLISLVALPIAMGSALVICSYFYKNWWKILQSIRTAWHFCHLNLNPNLVFYLSVLFLKKRLSVPWLMAWQGAFYDQILTTSCWRTVWCEHRQGEFGARPTEMMQYGNKPLNIDSAPMIEAIRHLKQMIWFAFQRMRATLIPLAGKALRLLDRKDRGDLTAFHDCLCLPKLMQRGGASVGLLWVDRLRANRLRGVLVRG
jgi:hypothetical protein